MQLTRRVCFVEFVSSTSAEKFRLHLQQKKCAAQFTSPSPNPFRTMPKETPHRQTSPPAQRGGYNSYNDRSGGYDRGRGAYTRVRGNSGGYASRGQAYQSYGAGYRGRGQQQRGGYSQQPMAMQPPMNMGMNGMNMFSGKIRDVDLEIDLVLQVHFLKDLLSHTLAPIKNGHKEWG